MDWCGFPSRFIIAACCLALTQCELRIGDGAYHDILAGKHDEFVIDFGTVDLGQPISGSSNIIDAPPRVYVLGLLVSLATETDCDKSTNLMLGDVLVSLSVVPFGGKAVIDTQSRLGSLDWTWSSTKQHAWIWRRDVIRASENLIVQEVHTCFLYVIGKDGPVSLPPDVEFTVMFRVEEPANSSVIAKLVAVTADSSSF